MSLYVSQTSLEALQNAAGIRLVYKNANIHAAEDDEEVEEDENINHWENDLLRIVVLKISHIFLNANKNAHDYPTEVCLSES